MFLVILTLCQFFDVPQLHACCIAPISASMGSCHLLSVRRLSVTETVSRKGSAMVLSNRVLATSYRLSIVTVAAVFYVERDVASSYSY